MGKLDKLIKGIGASALTSVAIDEVAKMASKELEKRSHYVKLPDVRSLPVSEAESILQDYDFKYSLVKLPPDAKYADVLINHVVRMTPHGGANVDPKTFIKIYYADEQTIQASQVLAEKLAEEKALKKAKNQANIKHVVDVTAKVSSNVTEKLHLKKSIEKKEEQ
ncbi:PASTA domain-containing protein [Convivina praedatoris]|uniref:PASTA domain-containing protein n=1 Tax=Convivina praedatoris TaxID=2880963 RepID=A0ABM9D1B7_9LACO|nr:PASTA domain-containing protein [Convivina sp. LMG 32447]CAH1851657.1 hypothetical protein R077815_00369 [Convivina sp. LMG 32447]CAH1853715.1 hypothetical protein LMG032447_00701 [Convivina sp. LMG 32447]CAH1854344.1 hypothetical protein R078138_00861 [Convivina sp. LMG 32447]